MGTEGPAWSRAARGRGAGRQFPAWAPLCPWGEWPGGGHGGPRAVARGNHRDTRGRQRRAKVPPRFHDQNFALPCARRPFPQSAARCRVTGVGQILGWAATGGARAGHLADRCGTRGVWRGLSGGEGRSPEGGPPPDSPDPAAGSPRATLAGPAAPAAGPAWAAVACPRVPHVAPGRLAPVMFSPCHADQLAIL